MFECTECQKLFANVDSYVLHQSMHKINREVSCGKCFKSFKTKFLKTHKCLTKVVTKTFTYLISENANQPTRIISDTFK